MDLQNVDVHGIMLDSQTSVDYTMSCLKHRERYNKESWVLFVKVCKGHFCVKLVVL